MSSILKIATAGSVDDGKSTLIGKLMYETNSITKDKLEAVAAASKRKGLDYTDLSLLTDGLTAEREQGITIDVAHIYFSTPKRKYIIADTPGHVEYTRNMVTGASNANVSLILIDARNGVVEQTYRHFYIATLLRIPRVIVCINKMDLVDYSQEKYDAIVNEFKAFADKVNYKEQQIDFIPISSLKGDNLVETSNEMYWYKGEALLPILENINVKDEEDSPSRFPVQCVIRPKSDEFHDFRGYAGRLASGVLKAGDEVTVLPSGQKSTIKAIQQFDQELEIAKEGQSVTVTLQDDIDISRGDMIVKSGDEPELKKEFKAEICWMNDAQELTPGRTFILQHGINQTKAKVLSINAHIKTDTLDVEETSTLKLNNIGVVNIKTAKPLAADIYRDNPKNGAFILIDEFTNSTVAVGFIFNN
jgi:sulfate adenylyltransferase subunit 1